MISFIECFGLFLSFAFNFCLIIDLIKMMRDPFSDKEFLMRLYLIVCPIFSVSMSIGLTSINITNRNSLAVAWIFLLSFIIMIILGIFSVYLANSVLNKPGISGSARSLILKRHVSTLSLFFICNLYIAAFAIFDINSDSDIVKYSKPWW